MKSLLIFLKEANTVIVQSLLSFLMYLYESVESLIQNQSPKKEGYDATFLSPSEVLRIHNKGFCLSGTKSLSLSSSHLHSLIIGGSGSGKSSTVIIPTIYTLGKSNQSMCIHDPSGELYEKTVGYLASIGYKITVLHFAKPEMSDGYNPLARVTTNPEIYKVATTFVQGKMGKGGSEEFWNSQAISFIALCIMILKKQDTKYHTFTCVKHLVDSYQGNPEFVDQLVAECNDPFILREYKNFLRTDKKVMSNIIATCRSALMLFADESIQTVTSFDTIDFDAFRKEKTVLYVMNKVSDMAYYTSISSTFFLQFFNHIMGSPIPPKGTRGIFMILDEASSLYLPTTLNIACANLRKWMCGLMLVVQDFNQLISLYNKNEAEAIKANCFSRLYFPGQPLDTCNELSAMLGKRDFEDEKGNTQTRVLLTEDEIRTMAKDKALLFCGSHRAIYTHMKPYYKRMQFSSYAKLPPPEKQNIIPFTTIPIIGMDNTEEYETDTQ